MIQVFKSFVCLLVGHNIGFYWDPADGVYGLACKRCGEES